MRALLACFVVTFSVLAVLGHASIRDAKLRKAVELIHIPRILLEGGDLAFQVRILGAIDEDRIAFVMLCDLDGEPCGLEELNHERWSQLPIEGSASPKLWAPRAWTHLRAGNYAVVAGLGPVGGVRVSDTVQLLVQGFGL